MAEALTRLVCFFCHVSGQSKKYQHSHRFARQAPEDVPPPPARVVRQAPEDVPPPPARVAREAMDNEADKPVRVKQEALYSSITTINRKK